MLAKHFYGDLNWETFAYQLLFLAPIFPLCTIRGKQKTSLKYRLLLCKYVKLYIKNCSALCLSIWSYLKFRLLLFLKNNCATTQHVYPFYLCQRALHVKSEWLTTWLGVCLLWYHPALLRKKCLFRNLPFYRQVKLLHLSGPLFSGSVTDGKKNRKTTSILPVQHFCPVCSYRVSACWALPSNKKTPRKLAGAS